MYILIISRGFPSKREPQFGCFEKDQADALVKLGHKVVVASVDSRFRMYWRKLGVTHNKYGKLDVWNIFIVPGVITALAGYKFNQYVKELQMLYLFKKIIHAHGMPDVIYGHYSFWISLGVPIKRKYGIPLIGLEHNSCFNNRQLTKYLTKISLYAYSNTDMLLAVSNKLRNSILSHLGKDSLVIYNMVGEEFCEPYKFIDSDKVSFVAVGSLIYRKGFDLLLEAFCSARLPRNRWSLDIIGGGEEQKTLQQHINKVGLQDNIKLLGQKTKTEIIDILKKSDVFVLSSRQETFGVVYIEAMALGLPVIATVCGGPEEFVQKSDGLLVPVNDVSALTDAIKYMYDHYKEYDRQTISENCKRRFAPNVIARQLTEVFEQVVEKHKIEHGL